jgi:hypothetical protein
MTSIASKFTGLKGMVEDRQPDEVPLGLQTMLLFGAPGTGKTTLAAGFPNHLYYDLENSASGVATSSFKLPRTWAAFSSFVDWAAEGGDLEGKQTLIIDTVTDLWELCKRHVFAELGVKDAADADWGKGWSAPRSEFIRVFDKLRQLHGDRKLGLVLIAHEEVEEIKTPTQILHVARPRIADKEIKDYVAAKMQMVLRTQVLQSNPLTGEVWPEAKFLTQAKATVAGAVVKDRTQKLPTYFQTGYDKLKELYEA